MHARIARNSRTDRCGGRAQQWLSRGALLDDRPLDLERVPGEIGILGCEQEGIEPATMVDALERVRRNAHAHRAPECVGLKRHVEQIGPEAPLGLAVGVAHFVTDLSGFAGQLATPRHASNPLKALKLETFARPATKGSPAA